MKVFRFKHSQDDRSKIESNKNKEPYLFLLPTYFLMITLIGYPLLNSVIMGFKRYKLSEPNKIGFNGLDNFVEVFADPNLPVVLMNSIKWVFFSVSIQFILGFILALALRKPFKGRNVYQSIVFLPWSISTFIVGLTFQWIFNGEYGPINDLLLKAGIISEKVSFLSVPGVSLWTVIIAMIWIGVPFFAIMILAALQSIPNELYEAADIDGAGVLKKFFSVTIPFIKPTIVITLLLRTIWIFNSADLIYVMTYGGPANTSNTLSSYMFLKAYSSLNFGQASALGILFMLILITFALVFMKLTQYDKAGDF